MSIAWQIATIEAVRVETSTGKTFSLRVPGWTRQRAGQHYDLRLTAADGYQAQRSYSIASAPELEGVVELTVERIEDGEISDYLHDVAVVGDRVEVRGPIGGYFVWERGGPLLLIGGGSGVVPLMAMLRHRKATGATGTARLLYSARTAEDLIYRDELQALASDGAGLEGFLTLTRGAPPGWSGFNRRIDAQMLTTVVGRLGRILQVFICGPTLMVEAAANGLSEIGVSTDSIRTERFGPTGA